MDPLLFVSFKIQARMVAGIRKDRGLIMSLTLPCVFCFWR